MEQNAGAKHSPRNRKSFFWVRFGYGALSGRVMATGQDLASQEDASLQQGFAVRVCKVSLSDTVLTRFGHIVYSCISIY